MDADPAQLAVAADITGELIAGIQEAQWELPTPCAEWSVRQLVEHVIAGNVGFVAAFGDRPWPPPGTATVVEDLSGAYQDSARLLVDVFRAPGALGKTVTVPFGTVPGAVALHLRLTELLVHGWDLARATGQSMSVPDELAEQELAFTRPALANIPPDRRPFGPSQPASAQSPAIDRLAACLGRKVDAAM